MTRRVSDVMTRGVITIGPDDTLQRAAEVMKDLNVGSLPVCSGDRLVGVVTDRDITVRAVSLALDPRSTPVTGAMTVAPKYCFDTDPIEQASALMQQLQIRRLPVIDADNKLVGIVTLGDIAVRGGRDNALRALTSISTPAEPHRPAGLSSFERNDRPSTTVYWALGDARAQA
jgi:CBS domain-containing protein